MFKELYNLLDQQPYILPTVGSTMFKDEFIDINGLTFKY